jgi:hypothetical protein
MSTISLRPRTNLKRSSRLQKKKLGFVKALLTIISTKVFPEATLHIVPDAGHSSREPGTSKLLVEVGFQYVPSSQQSLTFAAGDG